jgi:pimeloyl-ACP methyl ester carboxylesterase
VAVNKIETPANAGGGLLDVQKNQLKAGANDLYTQDGQYVCVHLPGNSDGNQNEKRLYVVVHGYGARKDTLRGRQNVRRLATAWGERVDPYPWVVIAPHFDERRFNKDYQRLNRSGLRADARLNHLTDAITQILAFEKQKERILLLGFSGGGQFVHRYLAFHGHRVVRAVVGAPGWFMWPNPCLPYPLGFVKPNEKRIFHERLRILCQQKMLLLVGEKDTRQGAFRRRYKDIDLCALQGENRRERAINWFESLKTASINENIEFNGKIQILKNTSHRVNQRFTDAAISFLSGSQEPIGE